ncbi:hypothetical protein KP509_33G049700 [Ceratopteris richardii]|nr:hypothetical protein KP509_33G049700 [Ceratopteris richardii]
MKPFAVNYSILEPSSKETEHRQGLYFAEEQAAMPSTPPFRNMKVRTSEACGKNFIIFDHSRGQDTVICHPHWLHRSFHNSSPSGFAPKEVNDSTYDLQSSRCKLPEAIPAFPYSVDLNRSFPYSVDLNRSSVEHGSLSCRPKHGHSDSRGFEDHQTLEAGVGVHMQYGQQAISDFHENTEEINVLLSSDDDLSSTGHSPSDVSSGFHIGAGPAPCTSMHGRKRKLEQGPLVSETDDADSGFIELTLSVCSK